MHIHVDSIFPLLENMKSHQASDLHLKAGLPPYYRVNGALRKIDADAVDGEGIFQMLLPIIPSRRRTEYEQRGDLDFAFQLPDGDRFRINAFRCCDQMNAAIRRVKAEIPTYESLHLPTIYNELIERTHEGLIIVCGVTGSGKSTTLAAMLEHINAERSVNIVTIEDPVEYVFRPHKAIISQREIGIDIPDYAEGLRYIVRQDPNVIFIGEMRDRNTMLAAIQAAETGHLVFGSLHTADTMQAFARILEFFPKAEHDFIRGSLSNSLVAILAQRLLPGAQPEVPRVPATEVLLNSPTARDLVRQGRDEDIPELISSSEGEGMHNFTRSLANLVQSELVFRDTAMKYAPNRDALASMLRGIKTTAQTMIHRVRGGGT
ncbi:MAG: PilT/PilU family type 4a pilus ATPase [Phycisphaerae bacterium]|nr:PilT/PilU family type 4a pilus ATPase [Phycisphaerae bacterium]NUQ44512.1 PilT/PilU family type 4a pilus ATPase [Phycisphaerae bacterium]